RGLAVRYQQSWLERTGLEYSAAAQAWAANQGQYLNAKRPQQAYQQQHDTLLEDQKLTAQRAAPAHQELVQLEARRQGINVRQRKDHRGARHEQHRVQLPQAAAPLLQQAHQGDLNVGARPQVRRLLAEGLAADLPERASRRWAQQSAPLLAAEQQPVAELN